MVLSPLASRLGNPTCEETPQCARRVSANNPTLQAMSVDRAALTQLADALAQYVDEPSVETREVEYTEVVEQEVVREKTVTDTKTVDQGPHPMGYGLLGGGLALGILLFTVGGAEAGILVGALGVFLGGASLYWWRKTETKKVKRTKEEPDTVMETVTKTKTVEEEVSPNKKVVRAGQSALTFQATETPDGCLVEGPDPLTSRRSLSFPTIDRPEAIYEATESIEDVVAEIPWVLDGSTAAYEASAEDEIADYEGDVPLRGEEQALRGYFEVVENAFSRLDTVEVDVRSLEDPALFDDLSPLLDRVGEAPDADSTLYRLLEGPGGRKLETFARGWEQRWVRVNVALLEARSESLFNQVGPDCYELGTQLGYSAFNFYCPHCNGEQQEELLERSYGVQDEEVHEPIRYSDTTRCVFLPEEEVWKCRTCERTTDDPIPIHRMLDDVLFPAYDHLMQENKNERLRIHSKARDQERDLQEKAESELDSIRRKHMSEIFSLSEEMERFQADIAGEREAIESMEELLDTYKVAQEESVKSIERFSQKVHDEIQARTEQVLDEVDTVKEREMEALAEELDELSKAQRIEDERRDALLSDIAENTERTADASERTAEATERTAEATERTADAAERTAEASEQQVREQRKTRETVEEVGNDIQEEVAKGNAIEKAALRKKGIDTDDYSGISQPIRAMSDKKEELVGTITGRGQEEIEARKMDNA